MMSLVWRKIQRSSKKPFKFRFTAVFHELSVHCSSKWQPYKLSVAWIHRRRRHATKDHKWEPTITNPFHGLIIWPASAPESLEMVTTMYKNLRLARYIIIFFLLVVLTSSKNLQTINYLVTIYTYSRLIKSFITYIYFIKEFVLKLLYWCWTTNLLLLLK